MLFVANGLIMAKSCRVDLDIRDVYFRNRDVLYMHMVLYTTSIKDMFQNVC